MDRIQSALRLLREEHYRISVAIHQLEGLEKAPQKSTRGRKSMGVEERKEVSARMTRYWAGRRKARAQG